MNIMKLLLLPLMALLLCFSALDKASAAESSQYYAMDAQQIVNYAQATPGRKVIFIYASWCPHCRRAFPQVIDIENRSPGSIIAVSADKNPNELASYLKKYKDLPLHAILLKGDRNGIERLLNVPPRTGIPHFILIDENNNVVNSANMFLNDVEDFVMGK